MLILLAVILVIISIWMAVAKKTRESGYLVGLCVSLLLEICGIMIFIAKKGGVSSELLPLFYFTKKIKTEVQYLMITLNQLGFLVVLGRTLFPFFLAELAIGYSMVSWVRQKPWLPVAVGVFPVITLALYLPGVYRAMTSHESDISMYLNGFAMGWMTFYIIASIVLLVHEQFAVSFKFAKRQLRYIVVCLASMTGIYLLFYVQDPGQIYYFYNYSFRWMSDATYMRVNAPWHTYVLLIGGCTVCCIMGFGSLYRFTRLHFETDKEDVVLERKFDTAKIGASTFVHSMKNQLLSSKVIFKRIGQAYEQPQVDVAKIKEYVDTLEEFNNAMLTRMEELYSFVKSNSIYMVPTSMEDIAEEALQRFRRKYPTGQIDVSLEGEMWILSDKIHLCEALYNLLVNAQEAVDGADRGETGKVTLSCYSRRQYAVIEISDNGIGIAKSHLKKIFDPFYSSKNSNSNWGMGLYYVREIVKSHLGTLQVESKVGEGSKIYILLPRYDSYNSDRKNQKVGKHE